MRVGTPGFVPSRLTQARAARRIPSKSALARLLSINPSTVSRWEDGSSAPDGDALYELSLHLNVRQEFFLRPSIESARPGFFRSLSNTLVRDRDYQLAQMRWLQEISAVLEHYVDLPALDIPDVLGNTNYRQLRDEDIESIALDLRAQWQLGEGPCSNVIEVMEQIGIVMGAIEIGTSKLDGLCSWSPIDDRPHVLLANDKMSFFRRQMDAAHELAHAVLHRSVTADELKKDLRFIESQAFRLASAFLMPSTSYPLEVRSPSLATMVALKERWRVSVKAQIKRLSDLEIIPPDHATNLYKLYSAKGWARGEPLDDQWSPDQPHMLSDALNLMVENDVRNKEDLLSVEFTISAGDIENLCGLPPGWFMREKAEVVTLKPASSRPSNAPEIRSTVLQFPTNK